MPKLVTLKIIFDLERLALGQASLYICWCWTWCWSCYLGYLSKFSCSFLSSFNKFSLKFLIFPPLSFMGYGKKVYFSKAKLRMIMIMMMMIMMNSFCGMVDWRKAFSLISSWDYCQRSSLSRIFNILRTGIEPAQNLSSGIVEWSCTVVITTTLD